MLRKFGLVVVISVCIAGCSTLQNIQKAVEVGTASITNPVTKERLNQLESAAILVFSALDGWKQACIAGAIPDNCKSQIAVVQIYTKQIPPYLAQLRTFVKNNDQVNAVTVFNTLNSLISSVRAKAANNGITITGS
jgi:hypothetical protein